jgi:sigma54-dependent transcription regulator
MTDELLSSELFGYEDGAFTGASRGGRAGKIEVAHNGTLFLDEVESMSLAMQVHLLRFLEEKTVVRVGANRPRSIDVRVVAATNVDLRECIRGGRFREDLFYRLNVFPILMPPLRARRIDIALIARHLLAREKLDKTLGVSALERLENYFVAGERPRAKEYFVASGIAHFRDSAHSRALADSVATDGHNVLIRRTWFPHPLRTRVTNDSRHARTSRRQPGSCGRGPWGASRHALSQTQAQRHPFASRLPLITSATVP